MTDTSLKSRALARIDEEIAEWSRILAAAEGRLEAPGITELWSLKDLAAHLTGWRVRSLDRLEAAARGEQDPPPPWPTGLAEDDVINEWIYEENKDRPAVDVLADVDAAFRRIRSFVGSLPDEELADPAYFPFLEGSALGDAIASGEFFGHYHDEHEPDVERWLATGHIHHP